MSLLATSIALALMNAACGGAADTTAAVTEAAVAGAEATTLDLDETGKRRRESDRRRTSSSTTSNTATTIPTTTASTTTASTTTTSAPTALAPTASTPLAATPNPTPTSAAITIPSVNTNSVGGPQLIARPQLEAWRGTSSSVGSILTVKVAEWTNQYQTNEYPMQREYKWLKDGQPIPGAIGLTFTPSEAGNYQVLETAYFIDISTGAFKKGPESAAYSDALALNGLRDPNLLYSNDLTHLGAYTLETPSGATNAYESFAYGARAMAFNPSGNGGSGSIFISGNHSNAWVGEVSIPDVANLAKSANAPLPVARLLSGSRLVDSLNGQLFTSGISGGTNNVIGGLAVSNGNLLISAHNPYSYNVASWYWTRSTQLTSNTLNGPFAATDNKVWDNPRAFAGYMAAVPPELETKLGGKFITGLVASSIVSTTADGPPIASFNPEAFDSVKAYSLRGKVTSATATTIEISNGSTVNDAYKGMYISVQNRYAAKIANYNGTTRVATIEGSFYADNAPGSVPVTGSDWVIVPKINATSLSMYKTYEFQDWSTSLFYPTIWDTRSDNLKAVIPSGARSVLLFGNGGNGLWRYGIGSGTTAGHGEIVGGIKVYDPTDNSRGEHSYPYTIRCWAYDANELEQVRLGKIAPNQVKPYAVWNFDVPFLNGGGDKISSVAYDSSNRRIHIAVPSGAYGNPIIHVYQVR